MTWRKGKGVAGWTWQTNENFFANLQLLTTQLDDIGGPSFDALPPEERYGLTAADLSTTRQYTGVCAIRLIPEDSSPRILGFVIIDYVGQKGFDCIGHRAVRLPVSGMIGGCAKILSAASETLSSGLGNE